MASWHMVMVCCGCFCGMDFVDLWGIGDGEVYMWVLEGKGERKTVNVDVSHILHCEVVKIQGFGIHRGLCLVVLPDREEAFYEDIKGL